MSEGREYPKIIAEREQSSAAACWREYLRLALNHDGSATLAACRYEALASRDEFTDAKGELNLPDEIAGKTVVGVEDQWIIGGELAPRGPGCTYSEANVSNAIDWVRVNGWVPTNALVAELIQAALVSTAQKMISQRRTTRRWSDNVMVDLGSPKRS